mmetsp:Transcript_13223/g.15560  ORF Transcript_13223/g.15560 Transcript_13223/m.15560 type:complete len:91 (-) Transcript_13223:132-404(-)
MLELTELKSKVTFNEDLKRKADTATSSDTSTSKRLKKVKLLANLVVILVSHRFHSVNLIQVNYLVQGIFKPTRQVLMLLYELRQDQIIVH